MPLAQDGGALNLICSVQDEWCTVMSTAFAKSSGIKVNMVKRSTGEALAQLIAEKSNPKTDVWFGGTGDPHMQAAELDLTLEYKSPLLPQLHPWAQAQAQQSGWRTVGVYSGPLGFGFNTELLATISDKQSLDQMQGLYDTYGISPDRIANVVAFAIDQPDDTTINEFTVGPAKQPW